MHNSTEKFVTKQLSNARLMPAYESLMIQLITFQCSFSWHCADRTYWKSCLSASWTLSFALNNIKCNYWCFSCSLHKTHRQTVNNIVKGKNFLAFKKKKQDDAQYSLASDWHKNGMWTVGKQNVDSRPVRNINININILISATTVWIWWKYVGMSRSWSVVKV